MNRSSLAPAARRPRGLVALAVALFALIVPAFGDRIVTRDGRDLEGQIVRETPKEVVIRTRFGDVTVARQEVVTLERGKTRDQLFEERWKAAESVTDYVELGEWAEGESMRSQARKCWKKIVQLEPDHELANTRLGHVRYKGEWLKPKEAEKRRAADEAKAKAEDGFVLHEGEWITIEDKRRIDQGLIQYRGRWMTLEEAKAEQGLALFDGEWIPAGLATTLEQVRALESGVPRDVRQARGDSVVVSGDFDAAFLAEIATGLGTGERWFVDHLKPPDGLDWLGGRAAAFYVFGRESTSAYEALTERLAPLSPTLPDGWSTQVGRTHGYYFTDPYCVSAARVWGRPDEHAAGHCYHHWGHLLLGRLDYDGRLLPPWFDEGFASLLEFETHRRNDVFCIGNQQAVSERTSSGRTEYGFESKEFRKGLWRAKLREAVEGGVVRDFDQLARKQIGELNLLDIAISMGIVDWLSQLEAPRGEPSALRAFLGVLRERAPEAPARVIAKGKDRQDVYDAAFRAATGMDWRTADRAWRTWFLKTN